MSQEQDKIFFKNFSLTLALIAVMMIAFYFAASAAVESKFGLTSEDTNTTNTNVAELTKPVGQVAIADVESDIIVEQGNFESSEYISFSESDLKGSLDNEKNENENNIEEISPQEERLAIDFQLAQAVDLMKGLHIYQESFSQ